MWFHPICSFYLFIWKFSDFFFSQYSDSLMFLIQTRTCRINVAPAVLGRHQAETRAEEVFPAWEDL